MSVRRKFDAGEFRKPVELTWLLILAFSLIPFIGAAQEGGAAKAEEESVNNPDEDPIRAQARELLKKEAAKRDRDREQILLESRRHLEAGKRLFEIFEYKSARASLERALRLDRSNEEARQLLIQVNDLLGSREDRIRAAVDHLSREKRVRIQEKLVELDSRIDSGRRLMEESKSLDLSHGEKVRLYERALEAFERGQEIIHWMDSGIDVDHQRNQIKRLSEESRRMMKVVEADLRQKNLLEAQRLAKEHAASLDRYKMRRLNLLIDRAKALFEKKEYEEAERLAGRILEEDPTNTDARTIESMARDGKHLARQEFIREELVHQHQLSREKAERMSVPYGDYLVYPDNWDEITRRAEQTTGTISPKEERWKQEIRNRLQRRVNVEFSDQPLGDVLRLLGDLGNVTMILDPQAAQEGARDTPITLKVSDMPLETALRWVLKLANLDFDIRDQAVFVARETSLQAEVVMQVYDIRDLTTTLTPFPGPRIDLGTAADSQDPFNLGAQPPAPAVFAETDIQSLIQNKLLRKEFENPQTSIALENGKLVVMQTPEVHEKIRKILQSFREQQAIQVLTNVRFIDVREGFLEEIGVHFGGLDDPIGSIGLPFARAPIDGLFPIGGGPGLTSLPADNGPSPAFQFQDSVSPVLNIMAPPFKFDQGPPSSNGGRPPLRLHPRIDGNFPTFGASRALTGADASVGLRRQWWEKAFGSPVLTQGVTHNYIRRNPLNTSLGGELFDFPQQGAIFQFRFLQSTQASAILQAVRKDQTSDILLSPRIVQFNNQRAHVLFARQRAYIADYDVAGAVFDPVIRSFLVGVVLDVQPTVSSDKRYITLTLRPGTAEEIEAPQIIFITNGGDVDNPFGTINLPIELPELELRSVSTSVTTPDGGTLLFSGLITDRKADSKSGVPFFSDLPIIGKLFSNNYKERDRRNLLVLVNAKLILFEEEEEKL